jgi:hypothetical protein
LATAAGEQLVKTIVIVDQPIGIPAARDRLLALAGEQFTPAIRHEAERLLGELWGDSTPEIAAMRESIRECSELVDALKRAEDERGMMLAAAILGQRWRRRD